MEKAIAYIPVPYGFKDVYGNTWWDSQVDLYNKIGLEIHQKRAAGFTISENLLNASHSTYNIPQMAYEGTNPKHIKVEFENGDSLHTIINGTTEEIRNYYLLNLFQTKSYIDGEEPPLSRGKEVIFIKR